MILVINAGSSSMKFQLYKVTNNNYEVICKGLAERINIDGILPLNLMGKSFKQMKIYQTTVQQQRF